MGLDPITIAALATATVSTVAQYQAQQDAKEAQSRSAEEQRKARSVQEAQQASAAAQERRQQIREERIKRGRILQASANTGTVGSSGEAGATGGLATQLGTNIGQNLASIDAAKQISGFNQNSADFLNSAQNSIADANTWGAVGQLSQSIFSATGGFKNFSLEQAPAPVETRTPKPVNQIG